MKKWTNTDPMRRLLSLALSMAMVLSVLPAGALAEEVESTPPTCDCEVLCAETVNESCPVCGTEGGQCAAVQQQKPEQQESEQKQEPVQEPKTETCAHGNDPETCEDCASEARVASVQALIVALPEDVTAETKEAAQSALSAVDEAKSALTESEQTKLDMTRYTALTQKLAALEAQANNCAHGNDPESCPLCAVQALIDALPDGDSITADNAEEVIEQMGQIDAAAMLLSEAELAKLDFTKFEAAEARLTELSEQTATDQPVAYADNISYLDSDGNTQTCTTATVVTGSDTEWGTADTDTWYVVNASATPLTIGTEETPQRVTVSGNVNLILENGCNFTVNGGIGVNEGNSLTIYAQSKDAETMGSLTARNVENLYAGIGGDKNSSGGNITINGGTVTATGGEKAACIGGGDNGDGGTITINGGVISAVGRHSGVGIGGGYNGSGGNITINGGNVTATGNINAAGIGGGPQGSGGNIIISGNAIVNATGGQSAAGIGGGGCSSGDNITISGNAIVNATGGEYGGAGIGGGNSVDGGGDGGNITISGGTVTATGGSYGAGIGGGGSSWAPGGGNGGTITITGGTVTANGGNNGGAGIGGGQGENTSGASGTFSTNGGSPVIYTSSISDTSGKDNWSGIIFEGNEGAVYDDQTLTENLTIPEGKTLTVPEGVTLTISEGVTLTNEGTLTNDGVLKNNGALTGTVTGNQPVVNVGYKDASGSDAYIDCVAITAEYLESTQYKLTSGWYVVRGDVTANSRITVSGNVNLILADGADLTVNGGIEVGRDSSLTIWGQEDGTGKLTAQNAPAGKAGIGGYAFEDGGTITINGGIIIAKGGGSGGGGAGIGGKCTVEINGGNVSAYGGGQHAAGIGGSSSTVIRITGGTVYAKPSVRGAAIGGNASQDGGTITITGGHITTVPQLGGACIGGGHWLNGSSGNHLGNGGTISISNAIIIANNNGDTSGIGGPGNTGNITINNSVVFIADKSRQDQNALDKSNSIIFKGNEGTVYGKPTLRTDLTIAKGQTLAIPEGTSLTIPAGVTLTNNGKVYLAGTLEGTIPGDVYYPLNLTHCTAEGDVVTYPDENGTPYAKAGSLITLTPDIPTNMAFTSWFTEEGIWDNRFIMPKNAVTITAKYEVPVASVTVDGIATNYAYFNEAYFAANNAKGTDITLKLLETLEKVPAVTVTGSFTLDLNGKKLTYTSMNSEAISVNGSLTITDSSDSKDGVIQNNTTSYVICNYGRLTIEGGAILAQNCICNSNNGTLVMNDGTLGAIGTDPGYRIFNEAGGTVTINGGTLKNGADRIFNTAEGITLRGGSFPHGIIFTDQSNVRSLLGEERAFYDLDAYNQDNTQTLVSVDNERTYIDRGVVVLAHPEHSFTYTKQDDLYHTAACACGYSEKQVHIFEEEGKDYNGFCKDCGAYQPADYEADSYGIKNAGQLFWFADYVNSRAVPEASFACGQLQKDITIPKKADGSKRAWMPIGIEHTPYCGWFNGNGHSISGLYFEGQMPYASLFGGVEGRIENLTIQSVEYDVSTDKIAGICGVLNSGQITNCTNAAHISSPHPDVNAAGICYQNNGTISGCTNAGEIHTGDFATAGGICVTNNGSISECTNTNTGTIYGSVAGGICVDNNRSISECTNEGAIHGSDAGGICFENGSPENHDSSIMNCANRGQINGNGPTGGICAMNNGTIRNSANIHQSDVAGICCRNDGTVSYCFSLGTSIVKTNYQQVDNCYYQADWETDEIDGTTFKTQEQFASGEVAYLLCDNPSSSAAIWGQTLAGENKQNYPVLDGPQVYRHNSSCPVYSNSLGESGEQHSLGENGICERCGAALEARVTVGGTDTYYTSLKDAFKAANEHTATITLLRDANIDETLEISGGEVTFQSAVNFDPAEEGPTFYTITFERNDAAIRVADGGIFNFESGILKVSPGRQQFGIVVNSGGTLNFRGGAITGSTEDDSIKMGGGEVNISGGTVGLVETSRGTLNISGGTVHTLRVYHATTNLRGGSFQKIHMMVGGDVVFTLLADGYAYYCGGSWVDATNDEDAMTLEGDIWVRSIPVKINTQPKDVSFTYGDTDKTLTVAASGDGIAYQWYQVTPNEGGDPTEYPVGTGNPYSLPALDAGSYQYFCRLTCEGYVLDTDPVTVTVNKAIVETPTVDSKEYTGENQKADISDTDLYTVTKNDGGTDVGTYDVTLKLKDAVNYKWSDSEVAEKTISFQITKADNGWTQEPAISGWTYGNTASTPTYKAKFGTVKVEYKASDAEDSRYSETVPTTAGSYTARFTVADSDNFNSLSEEKNFTINPKDITVTITPNGGTYGGTITPATAEINEPLVGNDQVDVTLTYTGTANDGTVASGTTAPTKAGTYTVTASINNGNYNLTGDTTAEFVIEKATVTTPTVDSKVYNGNTQTAEVPTSERYTVTENKGGTDAGDYNVVLSLTDSSNYQWDDKGGKTTFAITKATSNTWTTIPAITGWTYGGTASRPTGAAQFGTMKVEYKVKDAEDGSYSATVPTQAGSYTARFTVADTNNFNGLSKVRDFTIGKVSLTVKAKDHTITYGEKPANSGVEYSDFVDGEDASVLGGTLAYDYSYSRYGNVGDYTITPKGLTSGNYDITFEQGTLTVQQKEIGIDWSNTQLTYNGSAQIPTATPTGLENNDAITLAVSGEQTNVNVDTPYTATVTGITGEKAGNYALPQSVTTPFSIEKKEVTITGITVEATKVYDGNTTAQITSDGTLSANYDGDNLTIIPGSAAYDDKNVGKSKTVTFTGFSLGGSAAGNYTLTAQPAPTTASITKKPVTLAITVDENIFDGTNGVNYSTSLEDGKGFVDNDDVSIVPGDATFAYCYPAENIPVTFTAFSLSGADAGNYSITNPTPENVTGSIKVSNRYLNLENNGDFAGQTEVWVDGVACPVRADDGTYVALPESGDLLTIYTYKQGTSTAAHENYPTGMAVYSIVRDDGGAKLQKIDELDNLLQYSGCSIRINGKPGIRMITSLTKEAKELLKKGELAGYTLEEYGTVAQWSKNLSGQPLTLSTGNSNYAYKKGVSDPIFANVGNLTQYTNVLVWDSLPDAQLAQDILMRPYIILSNEDGETVTLYGGTVSRSIGYVAQQNADTFPKGSAGYNYVHDIIGRVANLNQSNESTTTAGG